MPLDWLFGRRPKGESGRATDVIFDVTAPAGGGLYCAVCGTELGDDPDDDPDDDPVGEAGLPLCGECNRARNFDVFGRFDDHDDEDD